MSVAKSRLRSAAVVTPEVFVLQRQNLQILAPIYDKVELLRRQMQIKNDTKQAFRQQIYLNSYKTQQITLALDRGSSIEKTREIVQMTRCSSSSNIKEIKNSKTRIDWSAHGRNPARSLIHFLASHSDKNKMQK